MRVAMSNLELQGSSLTATAVSSYQEQKVVGLSIGQASGSSGILSEEVTSKSLDVRYAARYSNESYVTRNGAGIVSDSEMVGDTSADGTAKQNVDSFERNQNGEKGVLVRPGISYFANKAKPKTVTEALQDSIFKSNPEEAAVSKQVNAVGSDEKALPSRDQLRLQIVEELMKRLMGKSLKFNYSKLPSNMGYNVSARAIQPGSSLGIQRYQNIQNNFTTVMRHESSVSFSAQGTVQTADGRTINLNLNFNVSQCVSETTTLSTEVQRSLCDPLVINFSGPMPKFTDDTMSFDIDCDGKPDEIGRLSSGSGYLALDKNGNGKIDDGSELFGPKTNNGYRELAAYDEDGNGWIDENDSIFDKLKIWCTDEYGNEQLVALRDKDVGAIYLGRVSTGMEVYSDSGSNTARVRESGLVLLESGESRVMQEMDLRI